MISKIKFACGIASLSLLMLGASACDARQDDSEPMIKAYQVEYAVAEEVYQVLSTTFSDNDTVRISAETRTNSLIILASPADHKKAERIIAELDRAPKQPSVKVFALAHNDCVSLAETLVKLLDDEESKVKFSFDVPTNSLVLLGEDSELERIGNVIALLDQPLPEVVTAQDCRVRVTWLTDTESLSADQVKDLRKPSANLQGLVKSLQQESMNDVKSVTVCSTRVGLSNTQKPKEFNNSSHRSIGGQDLSLEVGGGIRRSLDGKFELEISVDLLNSQKKLTHSSSFSLPANHPVALSVSDFGNFRSVVVIEVIHGQK